MIFKFIVNEFINTAKPVSSLALIKKYNLKFSSATIRSDMQYLENIGILEKTHFSSGRIPSIKGYRYYVKKLMKKNNNNFIYIKKLLNIIFSDRRLTINEVLCKVSNIISKMTNLMSIVLKPSIKYEKFKNFQFVPINDFKALVTLITFSGHIEHKIFKFKKKIKVNNIIFFTSILNKRLKGTRLFEIIKKLKYLKAIIFERLEKYEELFKVFLKVFIKFAQNNVYYYGKYNIFSQPEFSDIKKIKKFIKMLENSRIWSDLTKKYLHIKVKLKKNKSSELYWFNDIAVISNTFIDIDNKKHKLMLVGPDRMKYSKNISLMNYVSKTIDNFFCDLKKKG